MVVLQETAFYAESGGQDDNKAWIYKDNATAQIEDVKKAPQGQHIHRVKVRDGSLQAGDHVKAMIEKVFRTGVVKNHTATHLVHQALKDVLGGHESSRFISDS